MATTSTSLVIGRGELYFDPFNPGATQGKGEVYLGNTPEFTTSRRVEAVDVMDSFDGQRVSVEGPIIRENHSAKFTTDHISMSNFALWYGGDVTSKSQNEAMNISESFPIYRGRHYQLGVTSTSPAGARAVHTVSAIVGGNPINNFAANFEVDMTMGRIRVLDTAPNVVNGTTAQFFYWLRDVTSKTITMRKRELFGSLRFVSRNQVGPRKNLFYPVVKLTPSGDINHKGNDWQRLSFEVQALRRNPATDYVYIDEIAPDAIGSGITADTTLITADTTVYTADQGAWDINA